MTRNVRTAFFLVSACGFGFLLVWALTGLPAFGHYPGPYGDIITHLVKSQRHMANAVTSVVFDYRGFDTMGEEILLFAAASSASLLLRTTRDAQTEGIVDRVRSDATRGVGAVAVAVVFVLGLNVVAHGFITPGGGFQGGVVLASSFALLFLAIEYDAYHSLMPTSIAEPIESFGAGAYVGLGLISFAFGLAFLQNFMEFGVFGRLSSGGSAILVNWSSGLAVAGGFLVLFAEYLQEDMAVRYGRTKVGRS